MGHMPSGPDTTDCRFEEHVYNREGLQSDAHMKKLEVYAHIVRTAGTCGGRPRIDGHRISVSDIVIWHDRLGLTPEEIAERYRLSLAEVHSALAYYFDHVDEIQAEMDAAEKLEERVRRGNPSLLKKQVRG